MDEHVHRPLARLLVRALVRTPITPNQVTLVSALLGVAAGAAMIRAADSPRWMFGAAALLFFSVIFDCADGQLARAKGVSGTYGAILDGVADYVVGVSVAIGGTWFMVRAHGSGWYVLLGVVGTASLAVKTALFDNTKTRYIARIRTGYAEREDNLETVERDRRRAWQERRLKDALLLWIYQQYTRAQQRAATIPPAADPAAFRARNQGRMRAWTWLGSGTHFAMAYLALALTPFWKPAIAACLALYATVGNLVLAALMRHEPEAWGA